MYSMCVAMLLAREVLSGILDEEINWIKLANCAKAF